MGYINLSLAERAIRKTLEATGRRDSDLSSTIAKSIFLDFNGWNTNAEEIKDEFNRLRQQIDAGAIALTQAERLGHLDKPLAKFRTTLAMKADNIDMHDFASLTGREL